MALYLLIVLIILIFITQILIPVATGNRLFPMFRKDPLSKEVAKTKATIEMLKEKNANLKELEVLLKSKIELEKSLSSDSENKPTK